MPSYNFKCDECGEVQTKNLMMKDRRKPEGECCTNEGCTGKLVFTVGAATTVGGVKAHNECPEGFKDVLREIKRNAGKDCTIDV